MLVLECGETAKKLLLRWADENVICRGGMHARRGLHTG